MQNTSIHSIEPVAVIIELVIAAQSHQNSETRTQGEEYLSSGINPHLQGSHVHTE